MVRYPKYPKCKPTPCSWLQEVPEDWSFKRLKNVATHNDEALDERTDPDFEIEYVDISSVSLTNGVEKSETMKFERSPSRARRKVKHGDIIISTVRTYLKAIAPIKNPPVNMIASTGFAVIRPKGRLHSGYAGYLLQSNGFVGDVVANSVGVSYPAINASDLVRIPVLEPPFEEQKIIARFLDFKTEQIDALIAKKKTLLEKLSEKRTALISHAVTKGLDPSVPMKDSGVDWLERIPIHWVVKKLKYLAVHDHDSGIQIGPFGGMLTNLSYSEEGDFKVYGQENTLSGDFSKGLRWLTQEQFSDLANYHITPGDIVFTRKGSIGGCCIVPHEIHQGVIDSDTIRLRLDSNSAISEFIFYAFRFSTYLQAQVQEIKRGAILSGLNTTTIANLVFIVPPLDEQITIVANLNRETAELEALALKIEQAISSLQQYRATLITHAVTGKIDVRDFPIPQLPPPSKETAHA